MDINGDEERKTGFHIILVYVWNYFIRYSYDIFSKFVLILKTAVIEHTESSRRTSSIQADCGFLKFCSFIFILEWNEFIWKGLICRKIINIPQIFCALDIYRIYAGDKVCGHR